MQLFRRCRCLHFASSSPFQRGEALRTQRAATVPLQYNCRAGLHGGRRLSQAGSSAVGSNPQMAFPCLDNLETKTATLQKRSTSSGPEPSYTSGNHKSFQSSTNLLLDWGGVLPEYTIAYETWGSLNSNASNAILLHTGLSASSHAHSTMENPKPGWWEKFIGDGPEFALDTSKYCVICTNVIGGCYGSTGPGSIDPANGERYATRFPILTMDDMVRAQFTLLDHLGIRKLYASVGSSMGGMQSLAAGVLYPDRVNKVVSISGCARSHPYSIAMRHTQRQVLMADPKWNRGFYYESVPPHVGMKLAREIATITYRSGPEWEMRFGRRRADTSKPPALCPDFLIETYLDHAGEKWCLEYDANSLLYISKAMDLFDLGATNQAAARQRRFENASRIDSSNRSGRIDTSSCTLTLPKDPYQETSVEQGSSDNGQIVYPPVDLVTGLQNLRQHQVLVIGVASDILFPAWQQREVADALKAMGNNSVTHAELGEDVSLFGHDTFLLDTINVGGKVKAFLS